MPCGWPSPCSRLLVSPRRSCGGLLQLALDRAEREVDQRGQLLRHVVDHFRLLRRQVVVGRHARLDQHAVAVALVVRGLLLGQRDAAGSDAFCETLQPLHALEDVSFDPGRAIDVVEDEFWRGLHNGSNPRGPREFPGMMLADLSIPPPRVCHLVRDGGHLHGPRPGRRRRSAHRGHAAHRRFGGAVLRRGFAWRACRCALPPRERAIAVAIGIPLCINNYLLHLAIAEIPVPLVVLLFYLWPAITTA